MFNLIGFYQLLIEGGPRMLSTLPNRIRAPIIGNKIAIPPETQEVLIEIAIVP
jgi:hypothetical protein